MASDEDRLDGVDPSLGISLGNLPAETVDAMFAGLAWEAERNHGLSVRAVVAATFAAAKVESQIMADGDVGVRDRLQAAKQFKAGFHDACRLVMDEPPVHRVVKIDSGGQAVDMSVPAALEALYGDSTG